MHEAVADSGEPRMTYVVLVKVSSNRIDLQNPSFITADVMHEGQLTKKRKLS